MVTSQQSFRATSAPAISSRIVRRSRSNLVHRESFSDQIAIVPYATSTTAGAVLVNIIESLANLGQRISAMAGLYARWRVRRLKFRYVSSVPTSHAGSLTMAHFSDANYTISAALGALAGPLGTGPSAQAIASAMNEAEDSVSFPVWEPCVELTVKCKKDLLYTTISQSTGVQVNLTANGALLVMINALTTETASGIYGTVYVDGDIDFSDPLYSPGTLVSSLPQGYTTTFGAATSGAQFAATFGSTSASIGDIQAPFVVYVPSKSFVWGGIQFLQGIPIYFAADGAGSTVTYGAFGSPAAYASGAQLKATASSSAPSSDTAASLFFPAQF
jgi:hypothetical protein